MPFTRGNASEKLWQVMEQGNEAVELLRGRKLSAVRREGDAARSRGVWLIRGLQQALLYRTVMLADGCSEAWNARNPLSALLCARALIETAAVVWDLQHQFERLIGEKDFSRIYDLTVNRAHGTRLAEWLAGGAGAEFVNVVGLIRKLGTEIPSVPKCYDQLSEFCHPNYCGHRQIFSKLDTTTAVLTFGDDIWVERDLLGDILRGFGLVAFVHEWLTRIDDQMPAILELSEAAKARKK